jgi:6-phosphogluconolactonase (cycloisomerase 2 family)
MVSASMKLGGSRPLLVSAAVLALSACGSGDDGAARIMQPSLTTFAYVASAGADASSAGAIYEYGITGDSSAAPLAQSSIGAGIYPAAVVVYQFHVYVVNVGDGTISQYDVGSDGTLTPMSPATVINSGMHTLGAAPAAATIDPTGSFLYVTNAADDTLSQFSIGGDGRLTALTPSTVATGVRPVSIAMVILADGTPVYYVVNSGAPGETGNVSWYSSGKNGALTPASANPVAAGTNPSAIAINGSPATVYVASNCDGASCTGSIRQFSVGDGGALTESGAIATTGSHYDAVNVVINQDGTNTYVYVLSNQFGVDSLTGALWEYDVGSTGALTTASPPMLDIGSAAVAQLLELGTLYVLTTNSGVVANTSGTGGSIDFYGFGAGGVATRIGSTKIGAPHPVTMGILNLLPP